jgi:hypothetical protein
LGSRKIFGVLLETLCTEQFTANWSFRLGKQAHRWDSGSHPLFVAVYILLYPEEMYFV